MRKPYDSETRRSNFNHFGAEARIYAVLASEKFSLDEEIPDYTLRVWARTLGTLLPRLTFAAPAMIVDTIRPLAEAHAEATSADDPEIYRAYLAESPALKTIVSQLVPLEQHLAKDGYDWKEAAKREATRVQDELDELAGVAVARS